MTVRTVLPFPVLPGKTEADIRSIAERFRAEPDAYAERCRRAGITLERAYWQHTPMGDFVVAYVESERSAPETVAHWAQSDLELDRFFRESVREIHGIDITQPMEGPAPENVGEWVDPDVSAPRDGFAFCAPILPDRLEQGRAWAREVFASDGMTASRRALGQNKEVVTLVQTPQGPVTAVYLEGDNAAEANRRFSASSSPFDVEFRQMLKQLYPPFINFDEPVPGVVTIFDSEAVAART